MLHLLPELRSCEKVEVAVQGSPTPVIHMVSVVNLATVNLNVTYCQDFFTVLSFAITTH